MTDNALLEAEVFDRLFEAEVFERLFGDSSYHYDLVAGTVTNAANTRIIYLSTDILRGIYEALEYEAGAAWRVILHSCGYLWGKNVFGLLEKEFKAITGGDLRKQTVSGYLRTLEQYFTLHGWGKLAIYLDDAPHSGFVRVSLEHSLFADALNHVSEPVDDMIAGMLRGFFEKISGQTLGCVEAVCVRQGAPRCEFLISGVARIQALEPLLSKHAPLEVVLAQLRQH